VDKTWPKLLRRACSEPLATIWFEPIADLVRTTAVGYRARPRLPLSGADHSTWLRAAAEYGYTGPFAAASLNGVLGTRENLPANSYLIAEVDGPAMLTPEVGAVLGSIGDLTGVVLELTSLGPDPNHEELARALAPVRRQGALLAVRATGGGQVGLLQLIELAPDFVNVDSELIAYIDQRPRHAAAVAAIGGLASQLDAWLVADGVRRIEEIDRLRQLEVPLARGPLIGGDRELMMGLEPDKRDRLRSRAPAGEDRLSALAEPVRGVPVRPQLTTETTVVVDADQRPLEVAVPTARGQVRVHPPMCVQRSDRPVDVALRATSRPPEHQLAPVCLIDEVGHLAGLIRIEVLLRALAQR
jgi:EAL domain-containing protein (putative c-di-GMP-specific phosphodiesterase class I)